MRPAAQDAGQPARDEVGVDGIGAVELGGGRGVGQVERVEDEVVGAAEKRPVVGGEPLHHVRVAAEQQQEQRPGGEQAVPRRLQRAVEQVVLFGEPRQLVEDDDRRCRWEHGGQCPERIRPASGGIAGEQLGLGGQRGAAQLGQELRDDSTGDAPFVAVK